MIIGKEEFLKPLFMKSIKIENPVLSAAGSDNKYIQISNLSDIDFELVRSGMLKEITMADKVILYGRKTVLLSIEKSADFSKGSKTIALPYYVQNMLVAPEKPLEVRLSLAIE